VDATLIVRVLAAPIEAGVTEVGLNEVHEIPDGKGVTHDNKTN
jgi:hypothetical protein